MTEHRQAFRGNTRRKTTHYGTAGSALPANDALDGTRGAWTGGHLLGMFLSFDDRGSNRLKSRRAATALILEQAQFAFRCFSRSACRAGK